MLNKLLVLIRVLCPLSAHPHVKRVHVELVRTAYANSKTSPLFNIVLSAFVSSVLWETYPHHELLLWILLIASISIGRYFLFYLFEKSDITPRNANRWSLAFFVLVLATGLAWSLMTVLFFPSDDFALQLFEGFVIAGIVSASHVTLSSIIGNIYAYSMPVLLSFIIQLFLVRDSLHGVLALFVCAYMMFIYYSANKVQRIFDKVYHLNMENEKVAHELVKSKQELLLINERLDAALQHANSANEAKSRFLANMSHEIRTPMNGIVGMTEIALELCNQEEVKDCLGTIEDSAEALLKIVNDVLDLSKVEAEEVMIITEPFDLRQEVESLFRIFTRQVLRKQIKCSFDLTIDVPQFIIGDRVRIRQILVNLLGNAVKFTPEGGDIALTIENVPSPSHGVDLRFSVSDSGIGIAQDKLERIFQPFFQVDDTSTRRFGGTGLGLSISAQLVEKMGGRITVSSVERQGSTFCFTIPLVCASSQDIAKIIEKSGDPFATPVRELFILLVEDNVVNQHVTRVQLERDGHRVDVVPNGALALERYETEKYDVILMDCQMPVMDGYQATKHIRDLEHGTGYHVPIIALTAHAMVGEQERCLESGMDGYLTKPISRRDLRDTLRDLFVSECPSEQGT